MKRGETIQPPEPLTTTRERCQQALDHLHPATLRLLNPHVYPAGLEESLHLHREELLTHFASPREENGGIQ